jgi:hypothetical protein
MQPTPPKGQALPECHRENAVETFANAVVVQSNPEELLIEFGVRRFEDRNQVDVRQRVFLTRPLAYKMLDVLKGVLLSTEAAMAASGPVDHEKDQNDE